MGDPSLKYSETIECSESNPIENLLKKPTKKPVMKYKKSKVLSRVSELLQRLQAETIPESGNLNIENCPEDKPYIEMSPIGFTKEPENESDIKTVILPEMCDLSSDDEDSSGHESKEKKALIEDISEQTLIVRGKTGRNSPTIENEEVSTHDRTVDEVSSVVNELVSGVISNNSEEMVY